MKKSLLALALFMFIGHQVHPGDKNQAYEIITLYADANKPMESASGQGIAVDVFLPQGKINGDILVLPGWNFSRKRWQEETRILTLCSEKKYRCFFPEMSVSLYASAYYKETKLKWAPLPGGKWMSDVFLPLMQSKGYFKKGKRNYLLGLSTGGRGVALVSLQNPGLFRAGAAFSGDFNQLDMPKDNLMTALYGSSENFKDRWEGPDNPYVQAREGRWVMPIYLAHGKSDKVVPYEQSHSFFNLLKEKYPSLPVRFAGIENAGHDFKFWDSQLEGAFDFFLRNP